MKKALVLLTFLALAMLAAANDEVKKNDNGTVSITSKGADVRAVLGDLFGQAKKNYVIEPHTYFALHLSLNEVEFEEALHLVCKLANLKVDVQNGIYFVSKKPAPKPEPPKAESAEPKKPEPKPAPKGSLNPSVLQKRLTTRLDKTEIRTVFAEISKQTGVKIEIAETVPGFKIDAYLINTSLKYALDVIAEATKLKWRFTDNLSIELYREQEGSRVVVHS
ncbi:MAG TPA: hypothetical protein VM328_01525, partial [Fimbriimonadaceae bacterium]|nr:hypothetical protein [Fimbriimonadaceae bacterium]